MNYFPLCVLPLIRFIINHYFQIKKKNDLFEYLIFFKNL